MKRSRTLMAAMCGALAIACASTSMAMVHSTSVLAAGMFVDYKARAQTPSHTPSQTGANAHASNTQPWWSGFEDVAMNRLMAASQGSAGSGVAAAYIALKVKTLELLYLENTRAAVQRQTALLQGSTLPHDDFAKQLAARRAAASANIGKLKAQRASYIGYLAAQCHMSEAAMNELLADALQDKSLPRFAADVPRELPMAVLSNRSDIHLAAALYDADSEAMPAGVIDAAAATDAADAAGEQQAIDMPGKPLYAQAVAQARDQVATALQRLQAQSEIANIAYARVMNARAEFEQSKSRRDRAQISEVQLMEDFQGLLLDLHVLAAANGELALAWVVFMGSIGNDTSVDAVANSSNTPLPFLHKVSRKLRNP
ncbi:MULTISPECIES: hypothetical protein [unclassified Variovorax]|uniref:hypothetical protein n=1 Tax=unclassified Variovorax TaxID=663243 RepID=UPI001160BF84|nr:MULTISPECIES: hypothetical protein [unclassified Variovorax]